VARQSFYIHQIRSSPPLEEKLRFHTPKSLLFFQKVPYGQCTSGECQNLFRWWNGQVFSFETAPGTNRKDNDGFDSGMDEAEAALKSDDEFSGGNSEEFGGENFGDDNNSLFAPALNTLAERCNDLSVNFT
jgi:hypothetical protein